MNRIVWQEMFKFRNLSCVIMLDHAILLLTKAWVLCSTYEFIWNWIRNHGFKSWQWSTSNELAEINCLLLLGVPFCANTGMAHDFLELNYFRSMWRYSSSTAMLTITECNVPCFFMMHEVRFKSEETNKSKCANFVHSAFYNNTMWYV